MELFTAEFFSVVGFPAAICIYFIFTANRNIKHLTDAVKILCNNIDKLAIKLESLDTEVKILKYGQHYPVNLQEVAQNEIRS